jgi:hypothetical protein
MRRFRAQSLLLEMWFRCARPDVQPFGREPLGTLHRKKQHFLAFSVARFQQHWSAQGTPFVICSQIQLMIDKRRAFAIKLLAGTGTSSVSRLHLNRFRLACPTSRHHFNLNIGKPKICKARLVGGTMWILNQQMGRSKR